MARQVDVKALISHIIRGDGADRCRICMGDTSEGQVYLGDTVMLDGDRPVTLSELLEIIAGVEMVDDAGMPQGICRVCSEEAIAALHFKNLCRESTYNWTRTVTSLSQIAEPTEEDKTYYIFYVNGDETVVKDQIERVTNVQEALDRLNGTKIEEEPPEPQVKRSKHYRLKSSCQCPHCGKKFHIPYYLNIHLKSTMQRVCTICAAVVSKAKLARHLAKMHNKEVVECHDCHRLFNDTKEMVVHREKCHGFGSHVCGICGNGYETERALRAHLYSHTLFNCSSCSASFANRRCYKHHMSQCKSSKSGQKYKETIFICDYCEATYDKKQSLRVHIMQKHLYVLPFVCETCGKRTSTLAHLKSHEATHTSERKIYMCFCGAKLRTELGFQLHQRIHTGEKPYQCKECGDRFLSASRRLDHIKRRHRSFREMPHGCDQCAARFLRPFELKKHYKSAHYSDVVVTPAIRKVKSAK